MAECIKGLFHDNGSDMDTKTSASQSHFDQPFTMAASHSATVSATSTIKIQGYTTSGNGVLDDPVWWANIHFIAIRTS